MLNLNASEFFHCKIATLRCSKNNMALHLSQVLVFLLVILKHFMQWH